MELLVVIAIIVVLVAMVVPALERAVYEAEMAVCATRQRSAAMGAVNYASGERRIYPHRPTLSSGGRPYYLHLSAEVDDRPYIRQGMGGSLSPLLDPFASRIDLENIGPASLGFAHYLLFFGMRYTPNPGGGQGMIKLGDRLEWTDDSRGQVTRHRFSILVADWDLLLPTFESNAAAAQKVIAGHPDYDGLLISHNFEPDGLAVSWWYSSVTSQRGPLDLNFAFDDGSTLRLNEVAWDDKDVARVPITTDAQAWEGGAGAWYHLPQQPG